MIQVKKKGVPSFNRKDYFLKKKSVVLCVRINSRRHNFAAKVVTVHRKPGM